MKASISESKAAIVVKKNTNDTSLVPIPPTLTGINAINCIIGTKNRRYLKDISSLRNNDTK